MSILIPDALLFPKNLRRTSGQRARPFLDYLTDNVGRTAAAHTRAVPFVPFDSQYVAANVESIGSAILRLAREARLDFREPFACLKLFAATMMTVCFFTRAGAQLVGFLLSCGA